MNYNFDFPEPPVTFRHPYVFLPLAPELYERVFEISGELHEQDLLITDAEVGVRFARLHQIIKERY